MVFYLCLFLGNGTPISLVVNRCYVQPVMIEKYLSVRTCFHQGDRIFFKEGPELGASRL